MFPVELVPISFALKQQNSSSSAWEDFLTSLNSPSLTHTAYVWVCVHVCVFVRACVCARMHTQSYRTGSRDSDSSLSDGAETLEACIIDAVVNRGL